MMLYTASGHLRPAPPFDFAQTLRFLTEFPALSDEVTIADGRLTAACCAGGQPIVYRLADEGTASRPRLGYHLYSAEPLGEYARLAAVSRISFFLSLDDDLRLFYEIAHGDAHFSAVVTRLWGYHQVKFPTPFAAAIWTIFAQHSTAVAAQRAKRAFVAAHGGHLDLHATPHVIFPEPKAVAALDPVDLSGVVGPRHARYLHAAAEAFATMDPLFLREADYDTVERRLREIDGIGQWSARFILIRGLGRTARVPAEDRLLARAFTHVYGRRRPATPDQVRRAAARYGAWQGYWAHYLRTVLLQDDHETRLAA
jgi:DNA-3-methyladenine glycosylase II